MKKDRILVLGYFSYIVNNLDGQTVKTRTILSLLKKNLSNEIVSFDTQSLHYNWRAFIELLRRLLKTDIIYYLPAQRNLLKIFPFLSLFCLLTGKNIYYVVIGGWLPGFTKRHPLHRMLLKRINNIFVETKSMMDQLVSQKFQNIVLFPNFRIHNHTPDEAITHHDFRLVFMSRITKLKGIDAVFRLADYIILNRYKNISIDIYGPVINKEEEWFLDSISNYPGLIKYKGITQPEDIFKVLSQYDVMLFPTRYQGEGFPGTILDSYIAGIPVIASNWKYNKEFIKHGETGFLYDLMSEDDFFRYTLMLMENKELLLTMKKNANIKSREYSSDNAWQILEKECCF